MAALPQPFDANQHDPTQSVGGLPIGRHKVVIESSEVKPNSKNDGGYLQLNLKVIEGPQANASGAYRLNLYHSNETTVQIANKQLSAISHVTNVFKIEDSSQLHNIPFMIEVGPQKGDPKYTEVKKVFDVNGNEPGKAGAPAPAANPAAAEQAAPAQTAAPAWGAPQQAAPAWGAPQQPTQPAEQPAAAPAQTAQPAWGQPSAPAQTAAPAEQPAQAPAAGATPPWQTS